jgi:putative oxidoreductase
MEQLDIALLIGRIWAAVVITAHGINHARTLDGTAQWFESKGFRQPRLNARLSAYMELTVGAGLAVGLLTSVAAAALAATMFVAFWTIHRFAGFFVFHRPDEGYEYVTTVAVLALLLVILGPGSVSLDDSLGIADDLDGWVGVGIYAAGLLGAVGQLAVFWRKPVSGEASP